MVWILDPYSKRACVIDNGPGFREVNVEISTADGDVVFPLVEVFSDTVIH